MDITSIIVGVTGTLASGSAVVYVLGGPERRQQHLVNEIARKTTELAETHAENEKLRDLAEKWRCLSREQNIELVLFRRDRAAVLRALQRLVALIESNPAAAIDRLAEVVEQLSQDIVVPPPLDSGP